MDYSQSQNLSMDPNVSLTFTVDSSDSIDSICQPNAHLAYLNTAYLQPYSFDPAFYEYHNLEPPYFPMSSPTTPETPVLLPAHASKRLASPSGFSEYSADAESISEFEYNTNLPIASTSLAPIQEVRPLQSMQQLRRHFRELTYRDATRRNAADAIVKCMVSRPMDANTYYNTQHVPPLPELQNYIDNLDTATRAWVEEGSQRSIGTESNRAASDARKEKPTATLYLCRWCWATFTVNKNLATHVRAHLDLHVSFCNRCDYSSTSDTIPARHRKLCEGKCAKFVI